MLVTWWKFSCNLQQCQEIHEIGKYIFFKLTFFGMRIFLSIFKKKEEKKEDLIEN